MSSAVVATLDNVLVTPPPLITHCDAVALYANVPPDKALATPTLSVVAAPVPSLATTLAPTSLKSSTVPTIVTALLIGPVVVSALPA